jgi:TRAP-type mannitol/chloroaromatic compound transport system substrate-binding protein
MFIWGEETKLKWRVKMKKNLWVSFGLALLLSLVFLLGPATQTVAQTVIKWKGQETFPTKLPAYGPFPAGQTGVHAIARGWTEWIKQATNGRLIIDWAEPGAIYPPFEADRAVGRGAVQIGVSFGAYYTGRIPEADVETGLVFAWPNAAAEYECMYNYGLYSELKKVYAERNINWFPSPTDAIVAIGTTFPAPTPESIKGKKFRAVGIWGDYIAMLGGSPVPLPWGEIYMGLKLGTIDGWVAGSATLEELKLKEVAKGIVYHPRITNAPVNILINMDAFKALPKDIQDLLENNLRYVTQAMSTRWQQQCTWVIADAKEKYGVVPYAWSAEDVNKVTQKAVDTLYPKVAAKSARCAKLVDIVKKQMKDYSRIK